MTKQQQQVLEFMRKFNQTVNEKPTFPNASDVLLRRRLMYEELDEWWDATKRCDWEGMADGLADLLYVLLGTAITFGIDLEPIFDEVHRSNMTKVWPEGTSKNKMYDEGKYLKPPTYSPAVLGPILEAQGAEI